MLLIRSFLALILYILLFFFFFFLMIRRPPRSTLFPTRRSSDRAHTRQCPREALGSALPSVSQGLRNTRLDRKSTRLNSSHVKISYAVFCLKKKKITTLFPLVAILRLHTQHKE